MAKEIVQADLGRIRALLDEVLGRSDYSDVQRMGGLTNRTYCVTFADGSRIMGYPAVGARDFMRQAAAIRRLPRALEELRELKAAIGALGVPVTGDDRI